MSEILFFILGAILSCLLTHFYYLKSKKDSEILITRLELIIGKKAIAEIKESIHDQNKANEILKDIWNYLREKFGDDFMKFRCEFCGSNNIHVEWHAFEDKEIDAGYCNDCEKQLW